MHLQLLPTSPDHHPRYAAWLGTLLLLLLFGGAGHAQAPAWQTTAASTTGPGPLGTTPAGAAVQTLATDTDGNVFVAGWFGDTVSFGSTKLRAAPGGHHSFVAKWSPTANAFAWALQTTTTDSYAADEAFTIAVQGHDVYIGGIALSTNVSFGPFRLTSPGTLGQGSCAYVARIADDGASGSFRWATAASGLGYNAVKQLAVRGNEVYVGGSYSSNILTASPLQLYNIGSLNTFDVFVGKLVDAGTSASFEWLQGAGGTNRDELTGMVVQNNSIYLSGTIVRQAAFGAFAIGNASSSTPRAFLARLRFDSTGSSFDWAVQASTSAAAPTALAVQGNSCYVAGTFTGTFSSGPVSMSGGTGGETYVVKYQDSGTTATALWGVAGTPSSGEATPRGLAVRGNSLYVSGYFTGATARFGSTTLTNAGPVGSGDVYLAKLTDSNNSGTWSWALRGGGPRGDAGTQVVLSGQQVYVGGAATPPATFSSTISGPYAAGEAFVASVTDTSLPPVPVLSSVSPALGPVGATVVLTGANLTGTTGLQLNGTPITGFVVNAAGTSITFTVPLGATGGLLAVTGPAGTVQGPAAFCVQLVPQGVDNSRCGPGRVSLGVSGAPAGGSYVWYDQASGGTALANDPAPGFTTPPLSTTTTYYVTISTGSGATACEGPRTPVVATIYDAPDLTVSASGSLTICRGQSVTFTASTREPATFRWSTGATTASLTVTQPGSYTVTATSTNGCQAQESTGTVVVEPLPATPVITQSLLPNGAVQLSSSAATGNQWYVGGQLIPGATGATYVVTSGAGNGTYTVITTAATGCASPPSPAQSVTVTGTRQPAWAAAVQLLPNPAQAELRVTLPAGARAATVRVLNALGQQVLPATSTRVLDVRTLARGVYAVQVQLGAEVVTKRLVLE